MYTYYVHVSENFRIKINSDDWLTDGEVLKFYRHSSLVAFFKMWICFYQLEDDECDDEN